MASELSIERLDELLALAERATPSPWYEDALLFIGVNEKGRGRGGFTMSFEYADGEQEYTPEEEEANIKYLAACDPDTIRSLVAMAKRSLTAFEEAAKVCEYCHDRPATVSICDLCNERD